MEALMKKVIFQVSKKSINQAVENSSKIEGMSLARAKKILLPLNSSKKWKSLLDIELSLRSAKILRILRVAKSLLALYNRKCWFWLPTALIPI